MTLFFAFWAMVAEFARRFDRPLGLLLPSWACAVGVASMALGGAIGLACVAFFVWQGHGTPAPFDPPREFVATGPYHYCRNPMYLGLFLLLGGLGLDWRSVSVLLLTLLAVLAVHIVVVALEEPRLRKQFGPSYATYYESVPRWIPRL